MKNVLHLLSCIFTCIPLLIDKWCKRFVIFIWISRSSTVRTLRTRPSTRASKKVSLYWGRPTSSNHLNERTNYWMNEWINYWIIEMNDELNEWICVVRTGWPNGDPGPLGQPPYGCLAWPLIHGNMGCQVFKGGI